MEFPQYQLRPDTTRMIFPHVFKLLLLSGIFYGGIYFLTWTLTYTIPMVINLLIGAFLVVLTVLQILAYHVKFAKYQYRFFTNRIEADTGKIEIAYFNTIQDAVVKRGLFDMVFGTGTIVLGNMKVGPVQGAPQMKTYIMQLITYNRQTQRSYPQAQYQQYRQPAQQGV